LRQERRVKQVANQFFNFAPRDQVDLRTDQERRQDEALEDVSSILGAPRDVLNGVSHALKDLSQELGDIADNSDNAFVSGLARAADFTTAFSSGVAEGVGNIVGVLDVPTVVAGVKQNYKLYAKHGIDTYEATVLMFNPAVGAAEAWNGESYQAGDFLQELDGLDRFGRGVQGVVNTAGTAFGGVVLVRGVAGRVSSIASELDALAPVRGGDRLAGSLRTVNPNYPRVGFTENCVECAIAVEKRFSGGRAFNRYSASSSGPQPVRLIEMEFGGTFDVVSGPQQIGSMLSRSGHRSSGIVHVRNSATGQGHAFNARFDNGAVKFLDAQNPNSVGAGIDSFNGFDHFEFLLTTPGRK
jgi:filamentous hemagglutinin